MDTLDERRQIRREKRKYFQSNLASITDSQIEDQGSYEYKISFEDSSLSVMKNLPIIKITRSEVADFDDSQSYEGQLPQMQDQDSFNYEDINDALCPSMDLNSSMSLSKQSEYGDSKDEAIEDLNAPIMMIDSGSIPPSDDESADNQGRMVSSESQSEEEVQQHLLSIKEKIPKLPFGRKQKFAPLNSLIEECSEELSSRQNSNFAMETTQREVSSYNDSQKITDRKDNLKTDVWEEEMSDFKGSQKELISSQRRHSHQQENDLTKGGSISGESRELDEDENNNIGQGWTKEKQIVFKNEDREEIMEEEVGVIQREYQRRRVNSSDQPAMADLGPLTIQMKRIEPQEQLRELEKSIFQQKSIQIDLEIRMGHSIVSGEGGNWSKDQSLLNVSQMISQQFPATMTKELETKSSRFYSQDPRSQIYLQSVDVSRRKSVTISEHSKILESLQTSTLLDSYSEVVDAVPKPVPRLQFKKMDASEILLEEQPEEMVEEFNSQTDSVMSEEETPSKDKTSETLSNLLSIIIVMLSIEIVVNILH